jgi:hypothetical protein
MCYHDDIGKYANAPDEGYRSAPAAGEEYLRAKAALEGSWIAAFSPKERRRLEQQLEFARRRVNTAANWHFARDGGPVIPGSEAAQRNYRAGIFGVTDVITGEEGFNKCNLENFGEGLHTLQDSWSHQGMPSFYGIPGARIGHSRKAKGTLGPAYLSEDTDRTDLFPADARAAAMATYRAMKLFLEKCPCILNGPHAGTKSRCRDSKPDEVVVQDLEGRYEGDNVESEGGLPTGQ